MRKKDSFLFIVNACGKNTILEHFVQTLSELVHLLL